LILVDTSVWVDHLRSGDDHLRSLLESGSVLGHPFVIGEIACGNLQRRAEVLSLLQRLPSAEVAGDAEVLLFIDCHALMGRGIGYVDAHLLAAAALTGDARLWTRDTRLSEVAVIRGLAHLAG
jgi:hypothetical protein